MLRIICWSMRSADRTAPSSDRHFAHRSMNRWMDGGTYGRTERQTDGWMNENLVA